MTPKVRRGLGLIVVAVLLWLASAALFALFDGSGSVAYNLIAVAAGVTLLVGLALLALGLLRPDDSA